MKSNEVYLFGTICDKPRKLYDGLYKSVIKVERRSGVLDYINIVFSNKLTDAERLFVGTAVEIKGEFRSSNRQSANGKKSTCLYILCQSINVFEFLVVHDFANTACVTGVICKEPNYRITPTTNRSVSDLIIAVKRDEKHSSYIPCIFWGKSAMFASNLKIGTTITVDGRIQSREYVKTFENGRKEVRVTHELSSMRVKVEEDENNESEN